MLTFLASIFFSHFTAWHCGSITNGHLVPLTTMMPFSVLKSSDGNPCMFQSLMTAGSARNCFTSSWGDVGTSFSCTFEFVRGHHWKLENKNIDTFFFIKFYITADYFPKKWSSFQKNVVRSPRCRKSQNKTILQSSFWKNDSHI